MKVVFGSEGLSLPASAAALGNFDAVHKGHCEIISDAVKYARKKGILSVVYMISSRPGKDCLTVNTLEKRLEIMENLGADICVVEEFTEDYKNTSCGDFVKKYLMSRLSAAAVFVGFNYRFGKGAAGDVSALQALCGGEIKVFVKDCVKIDGKLVSSTAIREMIENGEVQTAAKFLGRYFSASGTVNRGRQFGRTIGFPTANTEYPKGQVVPKAGVYITICRVGDKIYPAITNVGPKPTVGDMRQNIETSISGFSQDIYGREIEVEFCDYIREIEKFESIDALRAQLERDMAASLKFFEKER